MPVKIISSNFSNEPVKLELVIETIETNRERVRTTGNMMITATGILIPAGLALLLYFIDKGNSDISVFLSLVISVIFLLISSFFSIFSSLLRKKVAISDMHAFVESLSELYNSELKAAKISFVFLILGIISMAIGVIASVIIF